MTKTEFMDWAKSRGWQEDRHGHLQKETTLPRSGAIERCRYKLGRLLVRREIYSRCWIRLYSGYYSQLSITPEGKLAGMKR